MRSSRSVRRIPSVRTSPSTGSTSCSSWRDSPRSEDAPGAGSTVHLHSTDVDGEWLVGLGSSGLEVTHEHAKGDLAIRGTASDLELLLYGRPALGEVEYFGDEHLVEVLRARLRR